MVVLWVFFGYDINPKNLKRNEGWSHCKRHKVKFISTIYILKEELPILSPLTLHFKQRPLTMLGTSQTSSTQWMLWMLCFNQSPLLSRLKRIFKRVENYILLGYIQQSIWLTEVQSLLEKSVNALMSNIHDRLDAAIQYCLHFPFLTTPLCQCGKKNLFEIMKRRKSK